LTSEAVHAAVDAASAFVARGGVEALHVERQSGVLPAASGVPTTDLGRRLDQVRRGGGVVVAAGGCFDILHVGHTAMLHAARALGDFLVVCINSDASVRRLKGDGRPIVGERDRAALVGALAAVDAVVVFDEPTPVTALERLRPDIFVKGADYAHRTLPEAEVLERWGGQVVVVPYVTGRSTSTLITEMTRDG
jgi:rfaE bifunctional protein nucleotidyltransferase chain/domain